MPASLTLLSQTPLLFKHVYWLSAAARWMLAGLWLLNQYACWPFFTQYCMSAGVVLLHLLYLLVGVSLSAISAGIVSHYQPCLLVWWIIIGHAFWFGTSLSAMPAGVVPHYRPCLLVWCLTVGHVFWCGASLWAMPVGEVPHYKPCLLSILHFNRHFDLLSADTSGMATSLVLLLQRCHHIRHFCWSGGTLRYACL